MVELDGFGLPCPMPLVMVKKEIDKGEREITIRVDNETAVKNITRLASKKGMPFSVADVEGGFRILVGGEGVATATGSVTPSATPAACGIGGSTCGYSVFIGKDHVGEGDGQLGRNLMKMAIYTLNQADLPPMNLLFMNSGVQLLCQDEPQIVDSVREMMSKGTDVLVCGTCLDYYGIKDDLRIGEVSNMYDILERMHESDKVITL